MKALFLTLAFFFTFNLCNAQILNNVGIKVGAGLTNQNWEYGNGHEAEFLNRYGFSMGLSLEFLKTDNGLSLVTDLGYIQKGAINEIELTTEGNPEGSGVLAEFDNRFDFLTFSASVKYQLAFGDLHPYVFAGPRIDYYMGYTSELDLDFESLEEDINKLVFGLHYGLGVSYDLGDFGLLLEFAHQPDFMRFVDVEPSDENVGLEITNRAFLLSLGLTYSIH